MAPPAGIDPNIWGLMNYVPPRGGCNHKESLLSSRCSCQRFMIHPVKVRDFGWHKDMAKD
jgi:hypothetical protein